MKASRTQLYKSSYTSSREIEASESVAGSSSIAVRTVSGLVTAATKEPRGTNKKTDGQISSWGMNKNFVLTPGLLDLILAVIQLRRRGS